MNGEAFLEYDNYKDFNRKTCDMIISEARNLAVKEVLPTLQEGDSQGVRFENGDVKTPDCFVRVHQLLLEGGCGLPEAGQRRQEKRHLILSGPGKDSRFLYQHFAAPDPGENGSRPRWMLCGDRYGQ